MKHCPQCEFTFDDRQELCDFDGSELRVVPEKPPSFKSALLAPAASGLSVRRLVRSRAGLAVLAVAGVALSALLIGYYDAANQPNVNMSASQTRNDKANTAPSTQVDPVGQVARQTDRPKAISTQRKIGADELTSSMVKRLLEGSSSRSIKSRRGTSTSKLVATKRGPSSSKLIVAKRKPGKVNRNSQARNQARPSSRERGRQQHSAARVANQGAGWGAGSRERGRQQYSAARVANQGAGWGAGSRERGRQQYSAARVANQGAGWDAGSRERGRQQYSAARVANQGAGWDAIESTHHRKGSKVVSILKKTGSILKKPFELIVDR